MTDSNKSVKTVLTSHPPPALPGKASKIPIPNHAKVNVHAIQAESI